MAGSFQDNGGALCKRLLFPNRRPADDGVRAQPGLFEKRLPLMRDNPLLKRDVLAAVCRLRIIPLATSNKPTIFLNTSPGVVVAD